jgi:predicted LPLAT superfamily acyltransferase
VSAAWIREPERSNPFLLRLMVRITLGLGWRVAHALLYPITAYFLLFSIRARVASRGFLAATLGREPGQADLFQHYFTFASTILDRVFLLTGRTERYDLRVEGLEYLEARIAEGRGCLLLGSHLGSFEVLRALADQACPVPVRALMFEENAVHIAGVFEALNPRRAASIIRIGSPGALLQVKEALAAGELVGILGDRIARGEKVVTARFLGRPATFPAGPVVLAGVLGVPVVLFFGVHRDGRRYDIRFEPFADRIDLRRERREADITAWVQRYAEALETAARAHPYNWFNFYDFWDGQDGETMAGGARRVRLPRGLGRTLAAGLGRLRH